MLFSSFSQNQNTISFGAAKDLHLKKMVTKHAKFLPDRVLQKATELVAKEPDVDKLPTLRVLHDDIYEGLQKAKSLGELKEQYKEFEDVIDFREIASQRPKCAKKIASRMPLEDFTLHFIKKLWAGIPQEEIKKLYGFGCRDVVAGICADLKIPTLGGNYLNLLKNSTEEGNAKTAAKARKYVEKSIENLKKVNGRNQTEEARAKHAAGVRQHYIDHPSRRENVRELFLRAWAKCSHIRTAQAECLQKETSYVQRAARKQRCKLPLTEEEQRSVSAFYERFWTENPEMKEDYSKALKEVAQEMKNEKSQI